MTLDRRLLLAVLCVPVFGCGPAEPFPIAVQGKVTLDGKPMPEGSFRAVVLFACLRNEKSESKMTRFS